MLHKELFELIKILHAEEVAFIMENISRQKDGKAQEFPSLKLFSYLNSCSVLPSEQEVMSHLYGVTEKDKRHAFKKLVYRTKEKVTDALSVSLAMNKYHGIEDIDVIRIQLYKKAALLNYLRFKFFESSFVKQLEEEIISIAEEYEIYSLYIEHLNVKKTLSIFYQSEKEINVMRDKLAIAERSNKAIDLALEWETIFKVRAAKSSFNSENELKEEIQSQIEFLKQEYEATKSKMLKYFILTFERSYCAFIEDHSKIKEISNELIFMVKNTTALRRKFRMGGILSQLAISEIYLGNYQNAIDLTQEAIKTFENNSRNYFVSRYFTFHANFYNEFYDASRRVLLEVFENGLEHLNEFENGQWKVFQAYLCIVDKDYKSALKILSVREEVSKDKVDWDFWVRVLSICLNFKIGNEDAAIMGVTSLKKQINRISKLKEFSPRNLIVFRIISVLSKNGFKINRPEIEAELAKLETGEYKWKPLTAELIPFEKLIKQIYI